MGAPLERIVAALDAELRTADVPDYPGAMNGLQVANSGTVHTVAVAVDSSLATIDAAVSARANLLVLHHGLFWGGVQPLVGLAYRKYSRLLANDIAVYSSHLPLDLHPTLGNNAGLARELGLAATRGFARFKTTDIGLTGEIADGEPTATLVDRVRSVVGPYGGVVRTSIPVDGRTTRRWAICSGGGASTESLREARELGVDTLIVGEGAHHTTVEAIEYDLCVVYAGHYATETLGVQSLGAFIESRFGVPYTFLHLPTGS
ncbi:MAG TPA: Nif3-like dinuclear metal center hexameric protein [Gemmatimonas sp.]|nr:Nif3-like dinuclear metal center hexameric protein [Gemmatimonas sp.]